jgi:lipopolysaccharide-assembly LptC-related protein
MSDSRVRIDPGRRARPVTALTVIAGIALGVLTFALYHTDVGWGKVTRGHSPVSRPASPDPLKAMAHYARELEMTDVTDGGPTYNLKVESIQFEPAPLGVFRVGFLQMPVFRGARLRIDVGPRGTDASAPEEALEAALVALLDRQGLTLGPLGGLASLEVTPLHIQVTQGGREALALEGDRASVTGRLRQLDLEGHVRLSAGGGARVLESPRLHLALGTRQVWTDADVSLRTPRGRIQTHGFRGEVSLQQISLYPALATTMNAHTPQTLQTVEVEEMRP